MNSFEDKLSFGQIGESVIARWVRARGYDVLPVYEKEIDNGKGPRLFLSSEIRQGELIAPDLLAIQGEKTRWVEAKHKSVFTWRYKSGCWQDGIDVRHYLDYQKVEDKTGWPVWLFFYHSNPITSLRDRNHGAPDQCPTGLYGASLAHLKEREDHRDGFSNGWRSFPMVYWNIEDLPCYASLAELQNFVRNGEVTA